MKESQTSPSPKSLIGPGLWRNKLIIAAILLFLLFNCFIVSLLTLPHLYGNSPSDIKYHLSCPYESGIFQNYNPLNNPRLEAKAVIVPHHLLAANLIHEALGRINPDKVGTVVLAGPNHLEIGTNPVSTSNYLWKTILGNIEPDIFIINNLAADNTAVMNRPLFDNEHSICGLVTFIKKYFPSAKIVPLAIKSNAPDEIIKEAGTALAGKCKNCLVIGSIDFSHGANNVQTSESDKRSIKSLVNVMEMNIKNITADSLPTIQLINYYIRELNITHGTLISNSNSYEISGKEKENITSYITVIY